MEKTIKQLQFDMQLCGMSKVSQKSYVYHIKRFEEYANKSIEEADTNDVRNFLHYLREGNKLSIGTVNHYHTCLKYVFQVTLEKPWNDRKVPKLRGYKVLPVVLSKAEVKKILDSVDNLKHKAILATVYSAGLRVSEVCKLKVTDIDPSNMQIAVRAGKGNKDRYSILSKKTLELLRNYCRQYKIRKDWLFPGSNPETHIASESVREILKTACQKARIRKKVTVHTLRHCFSTHMLEDGASIFTIKTLLGHSSISSTCRYLQMVRPDAFNIKSPMDLLDDQT